MTLGDTRALTMQDQGQVFVRIRYSWLIQGRYGSSEVVKDCGELYGSEFVDSIPC